MSVFIVPAEIVAKIGGGDMDLGRQRLNILQERMRPKMTTDEKIAVLADVLGRLINFDRNRLGHDFWHHLLQELAEIKDAE